MLAQGTVPILCCSICLVCVSVLHCDTVPVIPLLRPQTVWPAMGQVLVGCTRQATAGTGADLFRVLAGECSNGGRQR